MVLYVSNAPLPPGRRAWQDPAGNWRTTLRSALGTLAPPLQDFVRVQSAPDDRRLTLVAPSKDARRKLFCAIRDRRGPCRAHMHLTPRERANKAMGYNLLSNRPVHIKEMGDALRISI